MKKDPFVVLFAGAVGSSKTPIAHYLSCNLDLPILSNDSIRTEVLENKKKNDVDLYKKTIAKRLRSILESKLSFIYDCSVDRRWPDIKDLLQESNYSYFIISMNLSKSLLSKLYELKGYTESLKRLSQLHEEHQEFLRQYSGDIGLTLTDKNFANRLDLSLAAVRNRREH